jgi:thiol-disulfide isomerase/thioredoxin
MKRFNGIGLIAVAMFTSAAHAQLLKLGDRAPALKPDLVVKGKINNGPQNRKIRVIEFWATWCGPCISSMPHLSDLADKYRAQVDVISFNVWDYKAEGKGLENTSQHRSRITNWVKKNDRNMRYTVALDDAKESVAKTWLGTERSTGIPVAFVVDRTGKIVYVGHPNRLDKFIANTIAGKVDIAAATKDKQDYEKGKKQFQNELDAARAGFDAAIKNNDLKAFDAAVKTFKTNLPLPSIELGAQMAANRNPAFGMKVMKRYLNQLDGIEGFSACLVLKMILEHRDGAPYKTEAVKMSRMIATTVKTDVYLAILYHGRVLAAAGEKAELARWIEAAEAKITKEPADKQAGYRKLINQLKTL